MGCPLRCDWCHNPESQNYVTSYLYDAEKCCFCGSCRGEGDFDCLRDARKPVGYNIDIDELVEKLEKDRLFFEDSGGGVTISGGEPLAQPEQLLSLLEKCSEKDLSVCLDTSGSFRRDSPVDKNMLNRISRLCSRILFDIKILDPERYRRHTGGDLGQALFTLDVFMASGTPLELRVPLIPGINDSPESALQREKFFLSLNERFPGKKTEITYLDYHETGRHKYTQLGRTYPMDSIK